MRCKECKQKFVPKFFLQKYCMDNLECIKAFNDGRKEKLICDKVKEMKVNTHSGENKKELQKEINLLARKIDAKFGYQCIDLCGRPYGKQVDGAHFHSVGSNSTLRYNLHNIHSADSHCNNYSNKHLSGYLLGLDLRYGKDYPVVVKNLPAFYPSLKLTNIEIVEKLALVRKINRTFETYNITSGDTARTLFNNIIGIY